ncbi:hypothetical protein DM558_01035 [Entomomonas moraniae]|uniref:Uncharacterized protein n=1 Tax=Entomomonas moraniae TaxID=2213226 RepID=A0A3Q9JH68_9GAMM|nr:hypothetical protein [Entomomonas moraniae]AZS49447.1 hypothetical protein DM558_01035 [Entomomonas moraniae]
MDYIPVDQYINMNLHVKSVVAVANTVTSVCNSIEEITISFEKAKGYITDKEFKKAISLFDDGIKKIGNQYYSTDIQDDTGMKLILANAEEKKGNLERAAYLKRNVLEARIQIFNTLNQCNKITSQTETIKYIGKAWMENNREVVLQLFLQENNGALGQAILRCKPDDPQYNEVLKHLKGLNQGERKVVLPWLDAKALI